MRLIYVTNSRIPTEKAYGLQTVAMCGAFASVGADAVLVIPKRKHNPIIEDLFAYYGMRRNFKTAYMPIIDAIGIGRRFGFWVTRISYALNLLFSPKLRRTPNTVIFTRDLIGAVLLKIRGHRVFYDMHGFPYRFLWFWKKACQMMDGIICTNQWKMEQCKRVFGIPEERLRLARNGFDSLRRSAKTKSASQIQTGLPAEKKLVVYAGHLHDWKGVDVLAQTARHVPDSVFIFVGGSADEIARFKKRNPEMPDNVILKGQRPHSEIPAYLASADVLVLPNSARARDPRFAVYSTYDTSPLKLFEYMDSRRPIVASALPSIKEILNESNAMLVEPDNSEALARGIKRVLSDDAFADSLQKRAWQDVQEYSWTNRARSILDFVQSRI